MTKTIEQINIRYLPLFLDGFDSGYNWPDSWENHGKPGGPWASTKEERIENSWWQKGWDYGHQCKIKENRTISIYERKGRWRGHNQEIKNQTFDLFAVEILNGLQ